MEPIVTSGYPDYVTLWIESKDTSECTKASTQLACLFALASAAIGLWAGSPHLIVVVLAGYVFGAGIGYGAHEDNRKKTIKQQLERVSGAYKELVMRARELQVEAATIAHNDIKSFRATSMRWNAFVAPLYLLSLLFRRRPQAV